MVRLARWLGAGTAAYGAAVLVVPGILTKPTELTDDQGATRWQEATLARAVGVRDVASGLSMTFAPRGTPLQLALLLRIAADLGDAAVFGATLSNPTSRAKVMGAAAAWGALNLAALAQERRMHP